VPYLDLADGARLHYADEGEGRLVLLVHGGTGTGDFDWERVRPALRRRFRVITPDLRGHGRSSDPGWKIGVRSIGDDMTCLLEALGDRPAAIIAFSFGASAILQLLCARPGLTDAFVGIGVSRYGDPARIGPITAGPWPRGLVALQHEHGEGPDHWRRLRERIAASWVEDLRLDDVDLARLEIPVLVACGDQDPIEPVEVALELVQALPAAELAVLPGAGHFLARERPAELLAMLESFLDRHLGAGVQPAE
jgi:pimeloyl-ACP methyl ester carboxylesterase